MEVYGIDRVEPPAPPAGARDDARDPHFVPAPCQVACPIGTDVPSYIAYIWEGRYAEALEAITATNPFSSICGRVCDAPCEPACRRAASDGPLQIRALKRFVMDRLGDDPGPSPVPVTRAETIGIVGAGPAGLSAAHELCAAGFAVDVYEMTSRAGGMMVWGIPAFRLPRRVIEEDLARLRRRCPGLRLHTNTALGRDVHLDELKERHAAVLLAIGAWWGKPMEIPGERDERVVDGVEFLRRVNGGERPRLPATVVVVGGGDVAMDACRAALRLPGCRRVRVLYRRGPEDIPARRHEIDGALAEGVEILYHTQQIAIEARAAGLVVRCARTRPGEPDEDGRRRPLLIEGSEHRIECGLVIAAVGQHGANRELEERGLLGGGRIRARPEDMRTADPQVFAAGDGAFGSSSIVMAIHHGQRAAYSIQAFLDGRERPLPYRTPYRTRRVPVAQDIEWEVLAPHRPVARGLGERPEAFPEVEQGYEQAVARAEAARCYRCDAETGSADYSVRHREDLFTMARIHPADHARQRAMLLHRLAMRPNPYPASRPPVLDDLVFLPANLSRLVIDPYREACRVDVELAGRLALAHPFLATGFDEAPEQVREAVAQGLEAARCGYLGDHPLAEPDRVPWFQLTTFPEVADPRAAAVIAAPLAGGALALPAPAREGQVLGLALSSRTDLEAAIRHALDHGLDLLVLDGSGRLGTPWAESAGAPDLRILRDAVAVLRRLGKEESIDLVYFGGVRSGTDAAKLIGLGAVAVVLGLALGLAAGGRLGAGGLRFEHDRGDRDRARAVANLVAASIGEASMMARCAGKTRLHNLEPEDLRAITLASAAATGIPLVGIGRAGCDHPGPGSFVPPASGGEEP